MAQKMSFQTIKGMNPEELNEALKGDITAVQRAQITTLLQKAKPANTAEVTDPIEAVQEKVAADTVTGEVTERKAKAKPNETTREIESFTGDVSGVRKGDEVDFNETKTVGSPIIRGVVAKIFRWNDESLNREEVKIMVGKGKSSKRYYRFENQITKVVSQAEAPAEATVEAPAEA